MATLLEQAASELPPREVLWASPTDAPNPIDYLTALEEAAAALPDDEPKKAAILSSLHDIESNLKDGSALYNIDATNDWLREIAKALFLVTGQIVLPVDTASPEQRALYSGNPLEQAALFVGDIKTSAQELADAAAAPFSTAAKYAWLAVVALVVLVLLYFVLQKKGA